MNIKIEKKNKAYDVLLSVYKERFPTATKQELNDKFKSMITLFRNKLKKVNASRNKSGNGAEDVYESSIWCYDAFADFLVDQEIPTSSISIINEDCEVKLKFLCMTSLN